MEDIAWVYRFSDGLMAKIEDTYYLLYDKISLACALLFPVSRICNKLTHEPGNGGR